MSPISEKKDPATNKKVFLLLLLITAIWIALYNLIGPLANWISYEFLDLQQESHFGEAVAFFLYDVPKILLLLSGMVFLISILRTFFSPERTRALLGGKREGIGNILAALLGIVTPFCSCSAVPLFIGFLESGIPLGVTFSFLIAAPVINEVALVMLFGLFGWKVAILYVMSGLIIAVSAGMFIGRLHLEEQVEDFVWQIKSNGGGVEENLSWQERVVRAWRCVRDIVGKVWLYVIVGIGIGAAIHGYVPESALAGIMGKRAWWSVPVAVLMGVPLYTNAAGVIPIVSALMEKGASLGTALAFMMSVIGLSLPEMVILRRVLKPKMLGIIVTILAIAFMLTGWLFNLVL